MVNKRLRKEMCDTARRLHDLGLVEAETLREFEASRLPALKRYGAAEIKRLRLKSKNQSIRICCLSQHQLIYGAEMANRR